MNRKQLADAVDEIDEQIKELNEAKRDAYAVFKSDLEAAGMEGRRVSAELAATKAAIGKRRKLRSDPTAVEERDSLIDEILAEICTVPNHQYPSRAREAA